MEYYKARKSDLLMFSINLKKIQQGIKRSTFVGNDKEGYSQEIH